MADIDLEKIAEAVESLGDQLGSYIKNQKKITTAFAAEEKARASIRDKLSKDFHLAELQRQAELAERELRSSKAKGKKHNEYLKAKTDAEKAYDEARKKAEELAIKASANYSKHIKEQLNDEELAEYIKLEQKKLSEAIETEKDSFREKLANLESLKEASEDDAESRKKYEKEIADLKEKHQNDTLSFLEEQKKLQKEQEDANKKESDYQKERTKNIKEQQGIVSKMSKLGGMLGKAGTEALVKQRADKAQESKARLDELNAAYMDKQKNGRAISDEEIEALKKAQKEATKDANLESMAKMTDAMMGAITKAFDEGYNQAKTILDEYRGVIDARLQGSEKTFKDINSLISNNLALSPFVKTTKVLEEVKKATEEGIVYNIEQRAFLAAVSDKIASTFDAFDSNLMRIVRLQQSDSTKARLGMEAALTKFLNKSFEDSSYLKQVADTVTGALVDATSQLSRDQSVEFEFIVQKWLGSLSSVGFSPEAVTEMARGINYLATGDVTNLANNAPMQTLFAMAASRANLEFSEILLKGLDANKTNKLLEGVVSYLREIATGAENQVVKAAYGGIFNMSLSDFKAISNLSPSDIMNIYSEGATYSSMEEELNKQMQLLSKRTTITEQLNNIMSNVMYGVGTDLVSNPAMFITKQIVDFMESTGADIAIPFVNAAGFGLDLNTSMKGLMQMGLGIGTAMSLATSIAKGLSSGFGLGVGDDIWKASDTTKRGTTFNLFNYLKGSLTGTSGSTGTFAVSGSSSDVSKSLMSSATDEAEETRKITNKNLSNLGKTLEDLFNAVVGDNATSYIVASDTYLKMVTNEGNRYLKVRDEQASFSSGELKVVDSALNKTVSEELIQIREILAGRQEIENVVKLSQDSILSIDTQQLKDAISEILYDSEDSLGRKLSNMETNGMKIASVSSPVEIKNTPGERLQVSNLVW